MFSFSWPLSSSFPFPSLCPFPFLFSPLFLPFFNCYPISIALSCLPPWRKTLSWCKYPVWMNISWMEVVWLQAECVCMCARACLCVLMLACVHTEAQVILRYLNSTHSNKTTGHGGNGNVIGLWQDAVCEQKPVCPTGVVSYTSTLTRTHKNTIITYTYTHTLPPLFLFIAHSQLPIPHADVKSKWVFSKIEYIFWAWNLALQRKPSKTGIIGINQGTYLYIHVNDQMAWEITNIDAIHVLLSTMISCLNYVHNFQLFLLLNQVLRELVVCNKGLLSFLRSFQGNSWCRNTTCHILNE